MSILTPLVFGVLFAQVPESSVEPEMAWVRVSSDPSGAIVLLDGEPIQSADGVRSRTPMGALRLPLGSEHKLTFIKEGYEVLVRTFTVSKEAKGQRIQGLLRRVGEPRDPFPRMPAGTPPPDGPCENDPQQTGKLSLDAKPYGVVYLGAERLGETPLINVRVPVGCSELRLFQPKLGTERSFRINIEANKTQRYRLSPESQP